MTERSYDKILYDFHNQLGEFIERRKEYDPDDLPEGTYSVYKREVGTDNKKVRSSLIRLGIYKMN